MVCAGSAAGRTGGVGGHRREREGVPWGLLGGPRLRIQQSLNVPLRGHPWSPQLKRLAAGTGGQARVPKGPACTAQVDDHFHDLTTSENNTLAARHCACPKSCPRHTMAKLYYGSRKKVTRQKLHYINQAITHISSRMRLDCLCN